MSDFKIFTGLLKAVELDGRKYINTVASSSVVDRHGDQITPAAIQSMARQATDSRMTIFLNHEYRVPEDVFGTTVAASAAQRGMSDTWDLNLGVLVDETNPRALATYRQLRGPKDDGNGVKLGVSIGALIRDYELVDKKDIFSPMVIKDVELLEASIVGIPANPDSWVKTATKSLRKSLREGVTEPVTDEADGPDVLAALEELTKAKKPATHQHPHAHAHSHEHSHFNGTVHSHDHAHTHAHEHGDDHDHADDMQGYEHDHDHAGSYDSEHPHDEDDGTRKSLTGDELAAHLKESHPELPDSAFACIDADGRHYPHHTASGAVDKALLRNALSRIANPKNSQCGKGHLEAHAKDLGIGEEKDLEPDLTAAADSSTDAPMQEQGVTSSHSHEHNHGDMSHDHEHEHTYGSDVHDHNDHDHQHSASERDPDHDGDDDTSPEGDTDHDYAGKDVALEPSPVADDERSGDPDSAMDAKSITPGTEQPVSAELQESQEQPGPETEIDRLVEKSIESVLGALTQEVRDLRKELRARESEIASITSERDTAVASLRLSIEFVEKLARTPLGKKTAFAGPISDFRQKFGGVYDEEFLKFLENKQ